jgi:hypothetical protein
LAIAFVLGPVSTLAHLAAISHIATSGTFFEEFFLFACPTVYTQSNATHNTPLAKCFGRAKRSTATTARPWTVAYELNCYWSQIAWVHPNTINSQHLAIIALHKVDIIVGIFQLASLSDFKFKSLSLAL